VFIISVIVYVYVSFYIISVSLAARRRTLKCVVTKIISLSVVAFKTLTFHNVVWRHTWGSVRSLVIALLQIFFWFWQWKKSEYWSLFDEVIKRKNVSNFFGPPCRSALANVHLKWGTVHQWRHWTERKTTPPCCRYTRNKQSVEVR